MHNTTTNSTNSTNARNPLSVPAVSLAHHRLAATRRRAVSIACFAVLAAVLVAAAMAASAVAAPKLDLTVTHSPTTVTDLDGQVVYTIATRNSAPKDPTVGTVLTCDGTPPSKTWSNATSFTHAWVRNGVVIGGATASTYTVQPADQGTAIQCVVTGANTAGTGAATFAAEPEVVVDPQPATPPPATVDRTGSGHRPAIAGNATAAGQQLTCTAPLANAWPGSPTWTFAWLRNGVPATGASSQTSATTSSYTLSAGDVATAAAFQCEAIATNAGGAAVAFSNTKPTAAPAPTFPAGSAPTQAVSMTPAVTTPLVTDNTTSGTVALSFELPPGMRVYKINQPGSSSDWWTCSSQEPAGSQNAVATCSRTSALGPQLSYPSFDVAAARVSDVPDPATATATISGGGAPTASVAHVFASGPSLPFGIAPNTFIARALDAAGDDETQAGGHPVSGTEVFVFNQHLASDGKMTPTDHVRNVITDLPSGFVGNPQAAPARCTVANALDDRYATPTCPRASMVGGVSVDTAELGKFTNGVVYVVEPENGAPAQLAFTFPSASVLYTLVPRLRPEDGYAISVDAPKAAKNPALLSVSVSLCGYGVNVYETGGAGGHNVGDVGFDGCKLPTDSGANPVPFLTNPAVCSPTAPFTRLSVDSWEHPGAFVSDVSTAPLLTGCDQVAFSPTVSISPTSSAPDSPAGIDAQIDVPTDGLLSADGVAQSHLKKAVVTLPEGIAVNPSGATGLAACSDEQLKLGTNDPVACPDGAKIGTVDITTPVISEHLDGDVVLRTPTSTDPASGGMLRMAIVARNEERGLLVKLPGTATADPVTGRLTATFDDNPQLPFSDLKVKFKGGSRGILAMPQSCGEIETEAVLTAWNDLNEPVVDNTPLDVNGDCSFGFAPRVAAGMSTPAARGSGDFSFRFSREDGEQWVDGLTATLPPGLLASVRGVPLCSSADAEAGSCPVGSRIGTVDASAGSGDPFVLERKGDAYLTVGYKGCAYGLAVRVPVVAGPFDGSSPETDLGEIVVRQSVCVDPSTAQVTATSDPLPTIWHGIPLRVRSVTVKVDRSGFMVNPSDCSAKQTTARLHSLPGNTADASSPFQATGCGSLPYKPRIGLQAIGSRQVTTGTHPRLKAIVRQDGVGEAGIEKAVVRLPKSLALDPDNAQALCEFADGIKPDLDKRCPAGSIVGRARATSPLLNDPLVGNVYFVKNVRKDPKTGNEIRTLPMIIVALRGEIAVNLRGESSTTNGGKLVNTFASVPDAPISQFNLNIAGGKNGILAVTRTRKAKINLCASRQTAEADTDGQNGRRHDFNIHMKTPCTKKQTKAAKRQAKRAAAKARN